MCITLLLLYPPKTRVLTADRTSSLISCVIIHAWKKLMLATKVWKHHHHVFQRQGCWCCTVTIPLHWRLSPAALFISQLVCIETSLHTCFINAILRLHFPLISNIYSPLLSQMFPRVLKYHEHHSPSDSYFKCICGCA